jgi:hypothetical protein
VGIPIPYLCTVANLSDKMQELLKTYGPSLVVIYFGIFAACMLGFASAIRYGLDLSSLGSWADTSDTSWSADVGVWGGAFVLTKVLQPIRIAASILLAGMVVKLRGGEQS